MRAIAFDPGGTTGWAQLDVDVDHYNPEVQFHSRVVSGQIGRNNTEHHKLLWKLLTQKRPNVIICERFDNRGNEFAKLTSREYIGVIKLYRDLYPVTVIWLGADQAKEWCTNEKLTELGVLCIPITRWKHANDAIRHLVYYIVFRSKGVLDEVRSTVL